MNTPKWLGWLTRKVKCPHCFKSFAMPKAPFRCINEGVCDEPDQVLADHLGTAVRYLPRVFAGNGRHVANCPGCGKTTTMRVCPACHCELPTEMGTVDNPIVSIHGDTGSGKSMFIDVSLKKLPEALNKLGGSMQFACAFTDQIGRVQYVDPLFLGRRPPPASQIGDPDYAFRRALVYRLVTPVAPPLFGGPLLRHERTTNLAIYDTVGTQHHGLGLLQLHTEQIPHARAFIILIDPVCYDTVRTAIGAERASRSMVEEQQHARDVIERIATVYRAHHRSKVSVPTAFVVTKLDVFDSDGEETSRPYQSPTKLYPELKVLLEEVDHADKFDPRPCEEASEALKVLLQAWGGGDIVAAARSNFANHIFLAVSALGQPPMTRVLPDGTQERVVETINPRRIADPWLWILHRLGLLEAG